MEYLKQNKQLSLIFLILISLHAHAVSPSTSLIPVITESSPGDPLSAELRSTPFLAHLGDLSKIGYIEEEYEVSGTGNIYDYIDNDAQSPDIVITESDIDYVTRILIRRPINATQFNGTVYFEILNSTASWDDDIIWRMSYESFVNQGSAYVGITSDPITIDFLRNRWGSPEFADRNRSRYENLSIDRFGQIWDVISQSAALLKDSDNPENPMKGFDVQRIIQTGFSQSGGFEKTYANSMHSLDVEKYGSPVFDGYFIAAHGFSAKKINPPNPENDFLRGTDQRTLVDVPVPVIRFQTETEMLNFFNGQTGRQLETGLPNSPKIRTYEMAGGVHVDKKLETTGLAIRERDFGLGSPQSTPKMCPDPVVPISTSYVQSALLRALEVWIRDDIEPTLPSSLIQLGTDENMNAVVIFDDNGNAVGGLRSPQIEVPLGQYITNPFTIYNECFLLGAFIPFDDNKIRELYPTNIDYRLAVNREISRAVADGIILRDEADNLKKDMLKDAGLEIGGSGGGCTLSRNGASDSTFLFLIALAIFLQLKRRLSK
ncbi:MAG: alpha/beta hydrolase domain-containing protein [Pseudomonadota bacterium]|nr:alpha/beta hydrolase domain-containing protein [Pseudomonadota bacterium]